MTKTEKTLTYKGKPLARSGKLMYYGFPYDPYVIMMQIASTKTVGETEIADKIVVQLFNTDPNIRPRDAVVKKAEIKGLASAMELAAIWLERALNPSTEK